MHSNMYDMSVDVTVHFYIYLISYVFSLSVEMFAIWRLDGQPAMSEVK